MIRLPKAFLDDPRDLPTPAIQRETRTSTEQRNAADTTSLLGHCYAIGPEDKPFSAGDPAWAVHRIVEDEPDCPDVLVENPAGQRFLLDRAHARSIALPPFNLARTIA